MSALIKEAFEQVLGKLPIDGGLVRSVHRYQTDFVNKNREHTEFFGGNLTGVYTVRFLDSDKGRWFEDVLDNVDPEELREKLHVIPALIGEKGVFFVSGNVLSLSGAWLLHRLHSNNALSAAQRRAAMVDVLLTMQFMMLTSLMGHYFRYPVDRGG